MEPMLAEVIKFIISNSNQYYKAISIHILISLTALAISITIAVPLGIICAKSRKLLFPIINLFNLLRIIPSLAILVLVLPILGTGFVPAVVALIVLAIPPIISNTYMGFKNINQSIIESAEGMGMDEKDILFKIQIPLALPLILTGIRISSVEVIASATIASYIGAGGLGDFIFTGISMNDFIMIFVGAASVALLSIFSEIILITLQHTLTKYQRN
jgi:osmoprotectant transport system permease protein